MSNGHLQGKSYHRQTLVNIKREQFCDAHPASYGWQYLRQNEKHQLPVYTQVGVELMRHWELDCWLVQYLDECRQVWGHISEISANLETIKIKIEMELSNKQFTADIERLAA